MAEKKEEVKDSSYKVVGKTKASTTKKEEKVKGKVIIEEKAQKQMQKEKEENKEDAKKSNNILIIAVVIVIAIIVIIAVMFGGKISSKAILDKEIKDLFSGKTSAENIEIRTTGDYAIIEKAIKEYYKNIVDTQKEFMEKIEDDKIQTMLTIENYQKDGPEFKESKEYINSAKTGFNEVADKLAELISTEVIMAQIEDKNLNDTYTKLYKSYFFEGEDLGEQFEEIYTEIDDTKTLMNNLYDTELKILNFLSDNKTHWKVEGAKISFDSTSLLAQYNTLKVQLSLK